MRLQKTVTLVLLALSLASDLAPCIKPAAVLAAALQRDPVVRSSERPTAGWQLLRGSRRTRTYRSLQERPGERLHIRHQSSPRDLRQLQPGRHAEPEDGAKSHLHPRPPILRRQYMLLFLGWFWGGL